jgi:hypothetical protein
MQKDERDLLEVLRHESDFLEKGEYGTSCWAWRPSFIFEDSPTCINYGCKENPRPCTDCVLIRLVPPERRSEKFPCRHIPLDASGETLDSLYRYCDQPGVKEKVSKWLRATIERLEEERRAHLQPDNKQPLVSGQSTTGTPLYQKLHPKCANPACPTAFHWLGGGKFFRFRPNDGSAKGHHGVQHYWLCEQCSHVFTLVHHEEQGVMVKLLRLELSLAKARGESP